MTVKDVDEPGPTEERCHAIHAALKQRGVLVVLGVEPSDRPDGLFEMSRKDRRRRVRVSHSYFCLRETVDS
jgi:hypothetical protein